MSDLHCCDMMEMHAGMKCGGSGTTCKTRLDCPDCVIHYSAEHKNYGIMIHDGGCSFYSISFCPWCGSSLKKGKRR